MKEYFSHDFSTTSDPKIQAMIGEHGAVGYGLYWRIVEMLHNESEHKLPLKNYIYTAISKQMSTSVEQVQTFVEQCVTEYELMQSDGADFWIDRVFKNIELRDTLTEKRSKAGKISAEKRKNSTSVEQVLTSVEQNSTQGNKVNKIKGKENRERKKSKSLIQDGETVEQFYQKELELSGNDSNYKFFIDLIFGRSNNGPRMNGILSLPYQLTFDDFQKLLTVCKAKNKRLTTLIQQLENKGYYKTVESIYWTLNTWLSKDE